MSKHNKKSASSQRADPKALPVDDAPATPATAPSALEVPAVHTPAGETGDIRGVLIQIAGARLLLPNATIAEVLSYAPPEPVGEAAPAWLLGRTRWRGWQLPLVAFSHLAGIGMEQAGLGSKVVVLKALGGNAKAPYLAILTLGFPRLVTVSRDSLIVFDADAADLPPGVKARVMLNEDDAFVPDLEALEALVGEALDHAA